MTILDGEILGPENGDPEERQRYVRRGFWKTFAKAAGQVPFAEDLVASYYCAIDPQTPSKVRMVLLGALAYFVLPFDAAPDFLALIGFSDDIAVLTMAIAAIRGHITEAHRMAGRKAIRDLQADSGVSPRKG